MFTIKKAIAIIFLSSTTFACSSGGGGGDETATEAFIDPATCVFPGTSVALTTANAESVVSLVKNAIQAALGFANTASVFIDLNNEMFPSNPFIAACDISGQATITANTDVAPLTVVSQGDVLSTTFSDCAYFGATINSGSFETTFNDVTEVNVGEAGTVAGNNWAFTITGNADNLRASDSNINVAVDGDVQPFVSYFAAGVILQSRAEISTLTFADNSAECTRIETVSIASTATNVSTNPAAYSLVVSSGTPFSMNSTELGGTVSVGTQGASPFGGMENLFDNALGEIGDYFVELDDMTPPTSGVLEITGNASNIVVTVMSGGMVQIEVDEDLGMVGFEATINTTWDAL